MGDHEWVTVGSKGKPRRGHKNTYPAATATTTTPLHQSTQQIKPTEASIRRHTVSIEDAKNEIKNSKFFSQLKNTLSQLLCPVYHLVIYGLGSLDQAGAHHIRYQFALAILLADFFTELKSKPEAFDPVFNAYDHIILPLFNIQIIDKNEQGHRIAAEPTLFFMPHCESDLTDNLLATNKDNGTLHNVFILGNSFREYQERWSLPSKRSNSSLKKPETLLYLCENKMVNEVEIDECGFGVVGAFNDTSLLHFQNTSIKM